MPAYCLNADVTSRLQTGYATVLDDAAVTLLVTRASDFVQSLLAKRYWPFPAVSDTPATPEAVREMATSYAEFLALKKLAGAFGYRLSDKQKAIPDDVKDMADTLIAADGEYILGTVTKSNEELEFAGHGGLEENEALLSPGSYPYSVIAESVRIADKENGVDFGVAYQRGVRGWVLTSYDDEIEDGTLVSYEYSYLRHYEIDAVVSRTASIRTVRA